MGTSVVAADLPDSYIVVGDLHASARDNAEFRYRGLPAFKRMICSTSLPIVFAGDTIECLDGTSLDDLYKMDAALFYAIMASKNRGWMVSGNHDNECIDSPSTIVHNNTAITHGHQFDVFCSGVLEPIGDALASAVAWMDNAGNARIAKSLRVLRDANTFGKAEKFASGLGAKTLVMGHTHKPEHKEVDGIDMFVTGSWKHDPPFWYVMKNAGRMTLECVS